MPCFHPLSAFRNGDGRVVFNPHGSGAVVPFCVPCGQCVGCRYEKSRKWALRCMHEAQMYDNNCFITLTYADMPRDGSLCLDDWQRFVKRLRHKVAPFRYYMCGEYGELNLRPHFHACIFGVDWPDRRVFGFNDRGDAIFSSELLESTWGLGLVSSGEVTFESAAYVARYCMKKANSDNDYARVRYSRVCGSTGEEFFVNREFSTMSRNPGIGANWFDRYMDDVFPSDEVVHAGRKFRVPRYYEERLLALSALVPGSGSRASESFAEALKVERECLVASHEEDLTPERLAVRERVVEARLHFFERDNV